MNIVDLAALRNDDLPSKRRALKTCDASERLNDAASRAKQAGKREAAVILQQRACAISPESWPLWNHLSVVLWDMGLFEEAQKAVDRAFALSPDDALIHQNAGIIAASLRRFEDAERHLAIARERKFSDLNIAWSYAMALLDGGQWPRGLEAYECRMARSPQAYVGLPYPIWDGSDLSGKTIYVAAEQGRGDRILFSRYLYWLKQKYPTCRILFLPSQGDMPDMANLLWGYHEAGIIDEFMPPAVPWPKADFGLYMISLARFHGTTPSTIPPDPGFIRRRTQIDIEDARLPAPFSRDALRIGITWTGNPRMARNGERTLPLLTLMELMRDPRVQLYSLQGPPGQSDIEALGCGDLIFDCWPTISNIGITATAAIMLDCDLIITACTTTAHLAGALGVPCWTLLAHDPYWIWGKEGDSTPWYPQMKLYRQPRPNDWDTVFGRVRYDLESFIEAAPSVQRNRVLFTRVGDLSALDKPWAQQHPREMQEFLELVRGAKSILEIGSATGQTLRHFARVLAPGAIIRSIDLGAFPAAAGPFAGKSIATILEQTIHDLRVQGFDAAVYFGDSHAAETERWAATWAPYDLIFVDGDHTLAGVNQDWHAYGGMGRLVAFHDIAGGERGVSMFWQTLKASGVEIALEVVASEMGIGVVRMPEVAARSAA